MTPLIPNLSAPFLAASLDDAGGMLLAVASFADAGWLLLAEGEGGGVNLLSFLPLVAMALLAYFLFVLPQKAKDKSFQDMIKGLKENDRIVTTGGLHGVVTNVQRDAGRLTLRVDESTGAKIRIALWAVDSVVTDDK